MKVTGVTGVNLVKLTKTYRAFIHLLGDEH